MAPIKKWFVEDAQLGSPKLETLLLAGWEPFSAVVVDAGKIWIILRKER